MRVLLVRLAALRDVLWSPRLRALLLSWCGNYTADWASFVAFSVYFYEKEGLTGVGILVGVAYILRTIQKSFYSGLQLSVGVPSHPLETISIPERIGAAILMVTTLVIGLYPPLLLKLIQSGFDSPLMSRLVKGGIP